MSAPRSAAHHEIAYDRRRLRQWLAGEARADGVTRRRLLTLLAATATATALPVRNPAHAADSPIVKPLPPESFIQRGTNAETRWEALRGTGHHTPNALFFVRNHTATPVRRGQAGRVRLRRSARPARRHPDRVRRVRRKRP